jgi:hypothetical protein
MKIRAGLVAELGVNLVLPWLAYRLALPHWGELGALYASAVPPVVWSLVEFARTRRVDALSILVLLGIALSIVLMALGGSPRLLLMRESMASGAIGIVFLLSLAMRRPLTFYLARATVAREGEGGAARVGSRPDGRERASKLAGVALADRAFPGRFAVHRLRHLWRAHGMDVDVSQEATKARYGRAHRGCSSIVQ